jgi:single-stranded DNA-specific DHH superfamily exonuclease
MTTQKKNIVIYHKNCVDGFTASYFAKEHFERNGEICEFIPILPNNADKLFENIINHDEIKTIMSFDVGYTFKTFKKLFEIYPMIMVLRGAIKEH